jgi:two-component system cell cycle sensor histidine kinase PleC
MPPAHLSPQFFLTIRGKIVLAFTVLATITGALGLCAVESVTGSGHLVVHAYDGPLMAISHARLAQADFNALELALERRTRGPGDANETSAPVSELDRAVEADLAVVEERSATPSSIAAGRTAAQAFEAWRAVRDAVPSAGQREASREQSAPVLAAPVLAARVRQSLNRLGELTVDDGLRDRARSLRLIERDRELCILATVLALLIGCLTAVTLARKMATAIAVASQAAGRIAAGELDSHIPPGGADELGCLFASITMMRDNLRQMMDREAAARRSAQSRLADALEGAQGGIALLGPDGRVLTANSRIREFFPAWRNAFAAGGPVLAEIGEALAHPTGEMRLADGRWIRLAHSPSNEGGMVLLATDISCLKEREAALREARDEAEAANRAKTDFLSNMSHELRTPLSAVIGFSEMIVKETFGPVGQPRYREFADDILHAGRHLMDVLSDILDIAKASSGTIVLRKRAIRPEAVMRAAVRMLHEKARDADLTLETDIGERLPTIEADPVRLRQVLLNLLSNAIKFTPAGGTISAEVCRHPEGVMLRVRDTGSGMAQADIPRALLPFVQVDTSLARRHGGTGLGLPLTKIFVELHGGRLELESRLNVGTTASVVLPACTSAPPLLFAANGPEPRMAKVSARDAWTQEGAWRLSIEAAGQTGSQLNTSPERSSGMNAAFSAGAAILAQSSGVQPSAL